MSLLICLTNLDQIIELPGMFQENVGLDVGSIFNLLCREKWYKILLSSEENWKENQKCRPKLLIVLKVCFSMPRVSVQSWIFSSWGISASLLWSLLLSKVWIRVVCNPVNPTYNSSVPFWKTLSDGLYYCVEGVQIDVVFFTSHMKSFFHPCGSI